MTDPRRLVAYSRAARRRPDHHGSMSAETLWRGRLTERWLPAGLGAAWVRAYAAVWTLTLVPAAVIALAGHPLTQPARQLLELTLTAQNNAPPQLAHVLGLAAHNIPIVSWPLLLGVLGAHRNRLAQHVTDGFVLVWLVANTLPVGAALGAYGVAVVPYLPHLPPEWGGLALGVSGWLAQRRRALTVRQGVGVFVLIVCVLLCAGVLETFAVPHR